MHSFKKESDCFFTVDALAVLSSIRLVAEEFALFGLPLYSNDLKGYLKAW